MWIGNVLMPSFWFHIRSFDATHLCGSGLLVLVCECGTSKLETHAALENMTPRPILKLTFGAYEHIVCNFDFKRYTGNIHI